MQNNIQKFDFQNNDVRIVEVNNELWFVAMDVCKILEIKNPTMSLKSLDEDELTKLNLGGQIGMVNIISESGLYALILRSRKPQAKTFRKWVTSEVLPSIRKTGKYELHSNNSNEPSFNVQITTNDKNIFISCRSNSLLPISASQVISSAIEAITEL